MINRTLVPASWVAAIACAASIASLPAQAQTPATSDTTRAQPAGVLSLCEIETRLTARGITIHELEVRDSVVEVEGIDGQGKKVDLRVDRRNGEILSQKEDR